MTGSKTIDLVVTDMPTNYVCNYDVVIQGNQFLNKMAVIKLEELEGIALGLYYVNNVNMN
eukprot:CAMPEP_0170547094 /NCGR_PEP_ID=MMETSP0211-20121228/5431_1 /TAXON_ID=311385 /ORGANISM="Pseudokeronopsis sp., Strain OXSARD2" /LENGTH=59 /DNA_ID=CAMNT_0010851891 /DNA_START=297 /DNA_END=476 /DNA_ORIENTATION=+